MVPKIFLMVLLKFYNHMLHIEGTNSMVGTITSKDAMPISRMYQNKHICFII
jgi:hypothetical protein